MRRNHLTIEYSTLQRVSWCMAVSGLVASFHQVRQVLCLLHEPRAVHGLARTGVSNQTRRAELSDPPVTIVLLFGKIIWIRPHGVFKNTTCLHRFDLLELPDHRSTLSECEQRVQVFTELSGPTTKYS